MEIFLSKSKFPSSPLTKTLDFSEETKERGDILAHLICEIYHAWFFGFRGEVKFYGEYFSTA